MEATAVNSDDILPLLIEKPLIRTRWLLSVLAMSREEDLRLYFAQPMFAALLTHVVAVAIGTPEVRNWTEDVPLLEFFVVLLDATETVLITKGFLKVVMTSLKSKNQRVAGLFAEIFRRLCTPKYLRPMCEALAGSARGNAP
jgi:hypothetical protein